MSMSKLLEKCTARHSKPSSATFPELPTVTTWIRLALGAVYGVSLGLRMETRGIPGALFGLNVITFLPMFWFNSFLDANIDSYRSLNFAGVMNAFALMMLIWILFFTMAHSEEEASLGKIISGAASSLADNLSTEGAEGESADSALHQTVMEDEF